MPESANPRFDRIKQVFGTDDIPFVSGATLKVYFDHLKEKLDCPCLLTGIESMGYFRWEARFSFGRGSEAEYKRLREKNGSFRDEYELLEFDAVIDEDWDILVNVQRIPYRKRFTIPLSELQAVDQSSSNYELLQDYTVWHVNWRCW